MRDGQTDGQTDRHRVITIGLLVSPVELIKSGINVTPKTTRTRGKTLVCE